MKFLKVNTLFVLLLAVISCQCKKSTSATMDRSEGKMIEEGFKKATIVHSTLPDDCEYTFAVEGETNLFDPINLEDKYQKSQNKVWIKFRPLRMPNRCEKASPIEVTEIYKRK